MTTLHNSDEQKHISESHNTSKPEADGLQQQEATLGSTSIS